MSLSAEAPVFGGSSAGGSLVFFATKNAYVSTDQDTSWDVYTRSAGTMTLVSTGPAGGNGASDATFKGASSDGSRVFFETTEKLVSVDTDGASDVYLRSGGTTTLVSTGPAGGNGASDAYFKGASSDGSRVFFVTGERLVSSDTDASFDIYLRSAGTTTLVGPGAQFAGASTDGLRAFFTTSERLVPSDTDDRSDLYQRSGGTTRLLSIGPAGGSGPFDAEFAGASADGSRVFFVTDETLVSADTDVDTTRDVYERSGDTTTLLSIGPVGGSGPFVAQFRGASADGSRVFFVTAEKLTAGDDASGTDVFVRSGTTTTLVSTGPACCNSGLHAAFAGASADGSLVFFRTAERLVGADTDSAPDIYVRSGAAGTTTLVSTGPAGGNGAFAAEFARASADGSRVLFETAERLVSADTDAVADVYLRSGGTTTLVSTGPINGNGAFAARFKGSSNDGSHVFFLTSERLVSADTSQFPDLYERTSATLGGPK